MFVNYPSGWWLCHTHPYSTGLSFLHFQSSWLWCNYLQFWGQIQSCSTDPSKCALSSTGCAIRVYACLWITLRQELTMHVCACVLVCVCECVSVWVCACVCGSVCFLQQLNTRWRPSAILRSLTAIVKEMSLESQANLETGFLHAQSGGKSHSHSDVERHAGCVRMFWSVCLDFSV